MVDQSETTGRIVVCLLGLEILVDEERLKALMRWERDALIEGTADAIVGLELMADVYPAYTPADRHTSIRSLMGERIATLEALGVRDIGSTLQKARRRLSDARDVNHLKELLSRLSGNSE